MAMKKSRRRIFQAAFLACALLIPAAAHAAGQTDPFYTNLLDKAEKSFLAKNYSEAARDFEIAAFGLGGNKTLMAKAHVYLGICRYYAKDIEASEKSLQAAAAIMGDEGLSKLGIHESARPAMEKLLAYYGIAQPQIAPLPGEAEETPRAAETKAGTSSSEKSPGENTAAPKAPAAEPPVSTNPGVKLDDLKEGDIVPLEFVDTPPTPLKRVPAVYPNSVGAKMVEGTVTVNALVSETGAVVKTEIAKGMKAYAGFDQAALRAVRQWKFEPAVVKGIRVKVWLPVAIEFKKRT